MSLPGDHIKRSAGEVFFYIGWIENSLRRRFDVKNMAGDLLAARRGQRRAWRNKASHCL